MNLQDIIAYSLAGIMIIAFAYLGWASRKGQSSTKEPKEPKDK